MSNLNDINLPFFLKNKEMNNFYVFAAVTTFGESLISLFVPIYLYSLGYAVHNIIFFYFLISLCFVVFSYPGAWLVSKIGPKHSVLLSTPLTISFYIGLAFLQEQNLLFFILPFLTSLSMIFYNYGYHLNFIVNSRKEWRGKEVAFAEAVMYMSSVVAPFIGGLLAYHSFFLLYVSGALILLFGTLPLFLTDDRKENGFFSFRELLEDMFSRRRVGVLLSFSGYAVESIIGRVIWPIFLIIILVSVEKTGFIVTLSMIVSLLVFYIAGRAADTWDKLKLLRLGAVLYFFGWLARIFATTSLRIIIINSYKHIAEKLLQIPWAAHSYDLAARKGYFRFIIGREITYNLTRVVVLPFLMLLFIFNPHSFSASFVIAAVFSVFYVFLDRKN